MIYLNGGINWFFAPYVESNYCCKPQETLSLPTSQNFVYHTMDISYIPQQIEEQAHSIGIKNNPLMLLKI